MGLIAASAINSKILGKYFDNELANALCEPKFIRAPKKSTSSLKASFVMVLEPFPKRLETKELTPALSPSAIGGLSILNCIDTLGSLWFSTTNTFKPFLSSKRCGSFKFISGAGPDLGITLLSICAVVIKAKSAKTNVVNIFFICAEFIQCRI